MKTFAIGIVLNGKITIPENVLKDLRNMAAEEPVDGGPDYLNRLHKETYEDDDAFLQGALKHALRNIVRAGVVSDLGGLGDGVGYKVAPAEVTVSVPERVVTKVKAREAISVDRLDVQPTALALPYDMPKFSRGDDGLFRTPIHEII